jgi:hypothetical protein
MRESAGQLASYDNPVEVPEHLVAEIVHGVVGKGRRGSGRAG